MADINITSPGDNDIVSVFPADERGSRAALLALTNGAAWWGGTSGGSANAQTAAVSNTGITLISGLRIAFIAGFTNTGAFTLQVNALAATSVVLRNGGVPGAGAVTAGDLVEVLFDGTNFRILSGDRNYVDQNTYNSLFPVGFVQLRWDGTAPTVPSGVTATWTAITDTDRYLRINNSGGGGFGGSASESHTHSAGSYTAAATGTTNLQSIIDNFGDFSRNNHTHDIVGTSGTTAVSITPKFRDVRAYRRSA